MHQKGELSRLRSPVDKENTIREHILPGTHFLT